MPNEPGQAITSEFVQSLEKTLQRLRLRLREAEVQAPMQIFQIIEELRSLVSTDTEKARDKLLEALQGLAASEEEFFDWLQLDIQQLESKLLDVLSKTTDSSRVDLATWKSKQ